MGLQIVNDHELATTGIAVRRTRDASEGGDTKCLYDRVPLAPGASRTYGWLPAGTYVVTLECGNAAHPQTITVPEGDEAPAKPASKKKPAEKPADPT